MGQEKKLFGDSDTWFDPRTSVYHFLDYNRTIYVFDPTHPEIGWTQIQQKHSINFFLRYLELLSSISSCDDVARKLERVAGMKQSEFFLKFPNMTGNYAKRKNVQKGDFYELTNRLKNDAYEILKVVTLGIRHTTLNNWRNISKIRYSDGTCVEQNRNRNSHSNAIVSPLSSIL
jgi:hypothetical protein